MKFGFFSTKNVYIKLKYNYIEIVRLDIGREIKDKPVTNFSDSKIIFADFEKAETSIKFLLKKIFKDYNCTPNLKIIIQLIYEDNYMVSSVEKRAVLDSMRHCNAKEIFWINHNQPLTNTQAKEYPNRKE